MQIATNPAALLSSVRGLFGGPQLRAARLKFEAWWTGEPVEAVAERISDAAPSGASAASSDAPASLEGPLADLASRSAISQLLWGDGHLTPVTEEDYLEYAHAILVNSEKSMAVIGAGLGGGARHIASETGVWITAYEARPAIAAMAVEANAKAGLAKKVSIETFEPGGLELPAEKYHGVLCVGEVAFVEDKDTFYALLRSAISKGGSLLFADYMLAADGPAPEGCFTPYWGTPHLSTLEQHIASLEAAGFDVRVREDATPRLIETIEAGWAQARRAAKQLESDVWEGETRALMLRMLDEEARMWAERYAALQGGVLEWRRILAT